jgi:hypothetical protein
MRGATNGFRPGLIAKPSTQFAAKEPTLPERPRPQGDRPGATFALKRSSGVNSFVVCCGQKNRRNAAKLTAVPAGQTARVHFGTTADDIPRHAGAGVGGRMKSHGRSKTSRYLLCNKIPVLFHSVFVSQRTAHPRPWQVTLWLPNRSSRPPRRIAGPPRTVFFLPSGPPATRRRSADKSPARPHRPAPPPPARPPRSAHRGCARADRCSRAPSARWRGKLVSAFQRQAH